MKQEYCFWVTRYIQCFCVSLVGFFYFRVVYFPRDWSFGIFLRGSVLLQYPCPGKGDFNHSKNSPVVSPGGDANRWN